MMFKYSQFMFISEALNAVIPFLFMIKLTLYHMGKYYDESPIDNFLNYFFKTLSYQNIIS